jgi:hypothetical protein
MWQYPALKAQFRPTGESRVQRLGRENTSFPWGVAPSCTMNRALGAKQRSPSAEFRFTNFSACQTSE